MILPMTEQTITDFVHLHLHTEYSLLDGGNRIGRLVQHVRDIGMDAVAMTDHGNVFGAVEFYTKARDAGIKPILGIEAYVAPGDRADRQYTGVADGGFHLVLLAENQQGWRNILKLTSDSYLTGFYFKPRMDKTTLAQWADGLIAINGHLGSSIAHHLLRYVQNPDTTAHWDAAVEEARWHAATFKPNEQGEPRFYIEVQRNGVPEQDAINPHLIRLARDLNLPLVCDNDAHFMRAEDYEAHDTLCCISMAKVKTEENRLRYPHELYVKSPAQMAELFPDLPEAMENTVRIAERCKVDLRMGENHAPVVKPVIPKDRLDYTSGDRTKWYTEFCARYNLEPFDALRDAETPEQLKQRCDRALRELSEAGLTWRYGDLEHGRPARANTSADKADRQPRGAHDGRDAQAPDPSAIRARLDRELRILADKSISAYFLIVWDFVNWARQRGIPATARGSGVGTMVGYVLGLSNACPVRYGLLFERFTDPDRSEYPDIDIDICQDGRGAVIEYVRQKYGHVAQIITFGTLKARAAIKDVGRVLGLTPSETQRLANMVPDGLNVSIDEALEKEPDLRREYESRPEIRELIDTAKALEGQVRHSGVHAAGVVIATQPLDNIIPLARPTGAKAGEGDAITQWDGPTVEKFGLLKMDFLGLRTLSIIERAKALIRESLDETAIRAALNFDDPNRDPLDLDRLTYDDSRVFELFQRGDTAGVFQFESGGMRKLLMDMKPDRLEDLIAANALYRPGPMDLIPDYNRRKHGEQQVPKVHPIVDRFTDETYGVMVYQEQVMQICHELGGIPLRAAYTLIKAISKKKEKVINAERPVFIEGAVTQGLDKDKAEELFDLILKFAGYGFNKSHSTGYAIIAYQTAYLKTYFPNQYMAATLTYESQAQKVADWIAYLEDCRRATFPDGHIGIDVKPPDINLSASDFSVVFDFDETRDHNHGHVRFGLRALKGAGEKAIAAVVEERKRHGPYRSLFDFCERVPLAVVNKATIEALIKAGAFDSVHHMEQRAAMVEAIEGAVRAGQAIAADRASGQSSLFGLGESFTADAKAQSPSDTPLPRVAAWDLQQALMNEKEVLGFFVSSHPLQRHSTLLQTFGTGTSVEAVEMKHDTLIILGGMLTRVRPMPVRHGRSAGQKMAMITIEDLHGQIDGVLFADTFATYGDALTDHAMIFIVGQVDTSRGAPSIKVNRVIPIAQAAAELAGSIEISLEDGEEAEATLAMLNGELQRHARLNGASGRPVPVRLHVYSHSHHVILEPTRLRVTASDSLLDFIREAVGVDSCTVTPGAMPEPNQRTRRWQAAGNH